MSCSSLGFQISSLIFVLDDKPRMLLVVNPRPVQMMKNTIPSSLQIVSLLSSWSELTIIEMNICQLVTVDKVHGVEKHCKKVKN